MSSLALSVPLVFAVRGGAASVARGQLGPQESDGELVRRVKRGDRWAEEALYHRHVRAVTRLALRLLARGAEAEDVVQDAFVLALSGLASLREEEAFGDWLLRITVRQVHRRFRKRRLLRTLGLDRGEDDATLARLADQGASPETRAALAEIGRLLDTLPAPERVAWVLRRVEGQDLERVATTCDCSLATAKRRIGRADTLIREHVALAPEDDDA